MSIVVGGVETFSLLDYPDKISAVVFMQGCPWRCPFCHNSDLQAIIKENNFSWPQFLEFLKTRTKVLDAVVFSGGEPLVQNGLSDAIKEVKALGYKIGLHTGGYRPDAFAKVLPLLDWVGFDIKAPFEKQHYQKVTGPDHLSKVLKSLDLLIKSGVDFECRTTCDPRILNLNDIFNISEELKNLGVKKYYLQKYRPVADDKTTTDSDCENFDSKVLTDHLKASFEDFEFRK